jgi:hypothetical protein
MTIPPNLGHHNWNGMAMPTFRLEYQLTPEDISEQWKSSARLFWSDFARIIYGLGLASYGLHNYLTGGSELLTAVTIFAAGWMVSSRAIMFLVVKQMLRYYTLSTSVVIDEENVTMESSSRTGETPYSRTTSWTTLSKYGRAIEHPTFFTIEYGRAGQWLWIPKRAFAGEEEARFRSFVAEKMGDRSKFS